MFLLPDMPSKQLWPVKTWTGDLLKRPGVLCTGGTLVLMVFCTLNGLLAVAMLLTLCVSLIAVLKIYFDMFNSVTLDLNHDPDHLWGALTNPCVHFFKVKGALKVNCLTIQGHRQQSASLRTHLFQAMRWLLPWQTEKRWHSRRWQRWLVGRQDPVMGW